MEVRVLNGTVTPTTVTAHHRHQHKAEIVCLVCGDKASGRHYGVASCDGCRGFFKRSIRRNLDYVCKESNQCIVDVSRRNQCQACRFRRCLEVNMKRDGTGAVQHERAPRGSLKRTYSQEFLVASTAASTPPPPPPLPHFHPNSFSLWRPVPRHFPLTVVAPPSPIGAAQNPSASTTVTALKEDEVSSSATEATVPEPDKQRPFDPSMFHMNLIHQQLVEGIRDNPSNDINETAARLLFLAVRWTRTIPSFAHLAYRDQCLLLEETWCELFVLTAAQWGLNIDETNLLRSRPDMSEDRHESLFGGLQQLRQVVERLRLLRLDHTEFACLKALVLFKPETKGLRDAVSVEVLQDQTQMMLHDYCSFARSGSCLLGGRIVHPSPSNGTASTGRFGKVLLILPALRAIQGSQIIELFFRKLIGETPVNRLVVDLMMGTFV